MRWTSRTVKRLAVVALCATAVVATGSRAEAQEITLKAGTGFPEAFPLAYMLSDVFKPKVEKYSDGRMTVEVHFAKSLCAEMSCVKQVRSGQTDVATISVANYGAFGKTFELLTLPYLFKDNASAKKVMKVWLSNALQRLGRKQEKLKVLAIVPLLGFRNLENNKQVIRTPDDLLGLRIRVTGSPLDGALLKAWGARAVPVAWTETYNAVEQKTVDGLYIQKGVYVAMKFHEIAPFVTETGGAFTPMMIFMDLKRFKKLPPWARAAVDKAAAELQLEGFDIDERYVTRFEKGLTKAKAEGRVAHYVPSPAEMKQWRMAAAKAWVEAKRLGLYNAALARNILESQEGQEDLIAELERLGAL